MFNNGVGHHIHGGIFYNVGGDVNLQNQLQTHHNLTLENRRMVTQPLPGSSSGHEDARRTTPQQRTIHSHELHDLEHNVGAAGWERGRERVVRSACHSAALRPGLYDAGSRRRRSDISPNDLNDECYPGPSPSASTVSSGGPPRPFSFAPQLDYPLPSTSSSLVPYLEPDPPPSVHGGTFFTAANVNFYETNGSFDTQPVKKRRRPDEDDRITIIPSKHLKLIREIGNGPGYFLHTGRKKRRAVIVKVFDRGPTVRQQLESTLALSAGLMHPNVLRIEGVSSPASLVHFIAYEDVHWKNAEGPLAAALKNNLQRSITLGFKMIAGLSAGMNHLSVQGVSLGSTVVENFDIFLDVNDRFVISIHSPSRDECDPAGLQEQKDSTWVVFNALCRKILMSANRVLHSEQINRDPAILDVAGPSSASEDSAAASLLSFGSMAESQNIPQEEVPVPPRREYIWRSMDRGERSLAAVARRITLDLDMNLSRLHRLTRTDEQNSHRCVGYVREEITLATTTVDSAVSAHDTPSPMEICSVCHEVVGHDEAFRCVCGDTTPGSRPTIKCRMCKLWSHSDCVSNLEKHFTCRLCHSSPKDPLDATDVLDAVKNTSADHLKLAVAPPAPASDSTTAPSITKKPSKWKLSFGKSTASALGRVWSQITNPPISTSLNTGINFYPDGTPVSYWTAEAKLSYGTVVSSVRLADGTPISHIKVDGGGTVTLPCVNIIKIHESEE